MGWSFTILLPLLCGFCALLVILINKSKSKKRSLLPPGPSGWPLVGNLLDLHEPPHRFFYKLNPKYGSVLWLRFGIVNTMVIQSAEAATEMFKKCDIPFADKNVPDSLTSCGYFKGSVVLGKYGPYWRNMRRICSIEFLVHKKINATMSVRQKSMDNMIARIKDESAKSKQNGGSGEIELGRMLFYSSFETIGHILLSKRVMDAKFEGVKEFFDTFINFVEWVGKPNVSDFYPFLKWFDPQGIKRNTEKYLEKLLGFTSEIVMERIQEKQSGKVNETGDFLDALLDDEGDANADESKKTSVKNITIVLLEMFFGGTETTSGTIEWGMTELLRNPKSMKKIRDEIEQVVGPTRMVAESDLNELPYLQAAVKEILRLYPPIPLLFPRRTSYDTEFMGYSIPKNTQVAINVWAIHRDPNLWPDPLSFKPERFLDSDVDFKGQHFQMIPFGAGRRSCVGLTLGQRMVTLTIASLVQGFDWKLAGGVLPEAMDVREMIGLTLRKMKPVHLIPTPRI